jgi:hypothetical protein
MLERSAVRELLYRRHCQVQAASGMRVLSFVRGVCTEQCARALMRGLATALILAIVHAPDGTAQQTSALTERDLPSTLPGLGLFPSKNPPFQWQLETVRTPELWMSPSGFRLAMHYNSIDDQTWPFTRILDALVARACGRVPSRWSEGLTTRLYASTSLVPPQDLGGNGGVSFKKVAAATIGSCRVELLAQGARWHTLAATVTYSASGTGQAAGSFQYQWTTPVPADAITIADLQHALIWTRHYWAMVDGDYGPYTRRAVTDWQTAKGYQPTGALTPDQSVELVTEGLRQRDEHGWALLVDDAIGFSVGVPTKDTQTMLPKWEDGAWWYKSQGGFGHTVGVMRTTAACEDYYSELLKPSTSREVRYHARKDDWFVVSGVTGDYSFYSRSQCRGQGIVTVIGSVPTAQTDSLWFLFVALSNSLSLRSNLNLTAKPAPRLVFPVAAPGYANNPNPPSASPSVPAVAAPPPMSPGVDRSGKTNAIGLALSDGTELKARDVFERVSEAVFVVEAADRQGSAVAISDRELVTNCHVLGAQTNATIEREGQRMSAKLSSANSDADRCILVSDTPLKKWVRIRPYADIKVGERAFTVGAPQGLELTIAEGIVSSKRIMDGSRLLQTSAPISKGSSGGGLFDAQGYLLGVTTWMRKDAQNLNFAIAAEEYAK